LLVLHRIYGDWQGIFFTNGWRAAFFYLGPLPLAATVIYYLFTEDAADEEQKRKAAENASLKGLIQTALCLSVLSLALAYVMAIGIVSGMNFWLPTYFQEAFQSNAMAAGLMAAVVPVTHAVNRPFSGHISDYIYRNHRNLLPVLGDKFRIQWIIISTVITAVSMTLLTVAGGTGLSYVLAILAVIGTGSGLIGGAIFAAVPELFPERSGAASGVTGASERLEMSSSRLYSRGRPRSDRSTWDTCTEQPH
jgi:NNP family nitrate/nitrite transporter-like MFS transporter